MMDSNTNSKRAYMGKLKNTAFAAMVMLVAINGRSQVNLQTGSATFSLPMFSWQDDKSRLNAVVALSYSSGNGLKVNEVASNVGQGWNLVAGGVITRMQVGEPDDQVAKLSSQPEKVDDINKYPNGYLYSTIPATKGCPNRALTSYPIFGDQNHLYKQHNDMAADREQDYFSFQFNGRNGTFVLNDGRTNNLGDVGVLLGDSKLKISFARSTSMTAPDGKKIRTTISSFTVTDENGLSYTFSKLGLTKQLATRYCDGTFTYPQAQPTFNEGQVYHQSYFDDGSVVDPWVINSWYLTGIVDLLTGRSVAFGYSNPDRTVNALAGYSISHNQGKKDYSTVMKAVSVARTPELSSITCPDGHLVLFNPGAPRADLSGEYALGSVDVLYNGRYASRFQLNTSYFIKDRYGRPTSAYQNQVARLCLLSVKRYGADLKDEDRPYLFDYYMGSNGTEDFVPPSFFYAKDIWGYYNGGNSVSGNGTPIPLDAQLSGLNDAQLKGLCFMADGTGYTSPVLDPKPGYAKNGLLKQVVYPTGGTLAYSYDQNTGIYTYGQNTSLLNGQPAYTGGVHVSSTSATDGGLDGSTSNGCGSPIVTTYSYVLENGQPSLWGLETPNNSLAENSHYERVGRHLVFKPFKVPPFRCGFDYQYPGIQSMDQAVEGPSVFLQALSLGSDLYSLITQIGDFAALGAKNPSPLAIASAIIDAICDIYLFITECSKSSSDYVNTGYYDRDLNGSNPLPAQFGRVEVTESTGGNGKTVAEFTSDKDYPVWMPYDTASAQQQRYAPWAYGLPKKTTVYGADGYPVKQTENIYIFDRTCHIGHGGSGFYVNCSNIKTSLADTSCKCLVTASTSQPGNTWDDINFYNPANPDPANPAYTTDISSYNGLQAKKYDLYTGRTELDTTYERAFSPQSNAQFLQTWTHYAYNTVNYQPNQVTSQLSNGDITQKDITYSSDNANGVFATMLQKNMVNEPVSVSALVAKADNQQYFQLLGTTTTQYAQVSSGAIKPSGTLEDRYDRPGNYISTVQTQSFMYDANSNLTGMRDEGSHTVANIYGYSDKYIIASVINADPVSDRPAYTSFEDGGLGGWSVSSGTPSRIPGNPVTGAKVLDLASVGGLTAPLNTAKQYRLSFWASGNGVSVGSVPVLSKSGPVLGGMTYYEYDVPLNTSSVTVSGSGQLDELRLYPSDARMRTVTYDPLIGKTSECDENNHATYYEYDGLARLRFVKDKDRNVVKMYEYNYKQRQNGCPGTYYSRAASEVFTRGNCGADLLGGNTTYTVAAAKYTSSISQADADRQVEDELAAYGQQYANTNGTCSQLYYNAALSQAFTDQNCGPGYIGSDVTYSIPARRYSSTVDQPTADAMAQEEMAANGQSYANNGAGSCTQDPDPEWQATTDPVTSRCGDGSNGAPAGHIMYLMTDVNPFTNQGQQWIDGGADASCSAPPVMVNITFANYTNATGLLHLVNTATGIGYDFQIYASSPLSTLAGQIPVGTYNATLTTPLAQAYLEFYGYSQLGPNSFSLSGLVIGAQSNPFVEIDYTTEVH